MTRTRMHLFGSTSFLALALALSIGQLACGGAVSEEGPEIDSESSALHGGADIFVRPHRLPSDLLAVVDAPVYSRSTGQETTCGFGCGGLYCSEELEMAQRIFDLANDQRRAAGLAPFRKNACVTILAQNHSSNQARQHTSSHVLDGKDLGGRLVDADLAASRWGENIHTAWSTWNGAPSFDDAGYPNTAMAFWTTSPPHRANLLNPEFTILGVGVTKSTEGPNGVYYATQVFLRP